MIRSEQNNQDKPHEDEVVLGSSSGSPPIEAEMRGELRSAAPPAKSDSQSRDMRDARVVDKVTLNTTEMFATLFKKKPYSKYWSVEQKWDDIFKRFMAIQGTVKTLMMKNFLRDIEYYADVSISQKCADDLRFIQNYTSSSTNMRWLAHMFDSTGKSESGMLTGNLANLGHVVQCIKVRAPARASNDTFEERYFERQAAALGERFRGKYCLASLRPILPEKPRLVSRFSRILDPALLSNISYMGEPLSVLKQRAMDMSVPESVHESIDRTHSRLDQIPFESELYEYLIRTRNFAFALPRFMGVCYPSSCSQDDIRYSIQKSVDDQHQVVDIEFECEVEESDPWDWFTTPRLVIYLLLSLVASVSFGASFVRHILVDRLQLKRRLNSASDGGSGDGGGDGKTNRLANLIATLDMLSMDKCAGILFIKTKPASPMIDPDKVENNRSTSIDALKGFISLMLIYSELVHLGCLPVPFMWSKWSDAMFPFFRAYVTQIFLSTSIWTEAFYIISAYLISLKLLENHRPTASDAASDEAAAGEKKLDQQTAAVVSRRVPRFSSFAIKRYIRLVLPMIGFIMFSYVWPRLSNGFVMQDQANKILAPCDNHGWTNLLMFHNHYPMNETCLWPTHVSASFFQLHLLSYPVLMLLLLSLQACSRRMSAKLAAGAGFTVGLLLAFIGLFYSAWRASGEELIVPFLIDYLDFDNYRRVIEWTVMPTHNHLASYMLGIMLAYMVVKRRVQQEAAAAARAGWRHHSGAYMQRESSLESVVSSSTQELNLKPAFMFSQHGGGGVGGNTNRAASSIISSPASSTKSSRAHGASHAAPEDNLIAQLCLEVALVALMLAPLTASYYWNGLGQPMSPGQTFWYMIATKLCFNLSFGCLFYRHVATRKNSSNPWMITRFLVPIGRMSLMLFYVSWPVIWFDLLASLYQWHPSHYFVFEKFNEIVFITLILAMFAYGAFEGTVKIVQYQHRAARLQSGRRQRAAARFEDLFKPDDWDEQQPAGHRLLAATQQADSVNVNVDSNSKTAKAARLDNQMFSKGSSSDERTSRENQPTGLSVPSSGHHFKTKGGLSAAPDGGGGGGGERRRLSVADQYKLNAELRANYSFASIGLYESAGATDDLPSVGGQSSAGSTAGESQLSPSPSSAAGKRQ